MPVSREQIFWLYKILLGREPESEDSYAFHGKAESFRALQISIAESAEAQIYNLTMANGSFDQSLLVRDVVVFLHFPKCAGTTLHNLLVQKLGPCFPERYNGIYQWAPVEMGKQQLFSGHYDLPSLSFIPGKKKVVTLLRDPRARLISLYRFLRSHKSSTISSSENIGMNMGLAHLARQLSPEDFFNHPVLATHPSINNCLVRTLSGPLGIKHWPAYFPGKTFGPALVDVSPQEALVFSVNALRTCFVAYGIVEHMAASVNHIYAKLGFKKLADIPTDNAIDHRVALGDTLIEQVDRVELTDRLQGVLERHTSLDQVLYDTAVSDLQQQKVI